MFNIITQHPAVFTIAAYWIFSAIVGGMPPATAASSKAYAWAQNSLQILAGNLSSAISVRYPALNVPAGSAVEHRETQTTTVVTPK